MTSVALGYEEIVISRLVQLGLVMCLLLVTGACGDDGGGSVRTETESSPSAATSAPAAPSGLPGGDELTVVNHLAPDDSLLNPTGVAIETVIRTASPDQLLVLFWSGVEECYGLHHVSVEENDDEVRIGVFTGTVPGAAVCIELAQRYAATVSLSRGVDGRAIIDGSS